MAMAQAMMNAMQQPKQAEGGTPAPAQPQGQGQGSADTKFCMNCGTKIPRAAKFCAECGSAQQ
jgi:membrane protease subunit (stomatin/prohibitin family)